MFKKIVMGVGAVLLVGPAYLYTAHGSLVRGGSGYAAKNICSGYFLSGFPPDVTKEQALAGASEELARFSYKLDLDERRVTANLFGMFERRAIYTPGIGCTLLTAGEKQAAMPIAPLPALNISSQSPWPLGSAAPDKTDRYDALLAEAFAEEDPNRPRNTKAIVVIHRGKLIAERYADGVTPETPLIGWSMAKSVTALMAGLLVEDGTLRPDAPAPVPEWRARENDPRAQITLDQLLRMSSGLEFDETYGGATDVSHMLSNEPDTGAFAAAKPLTGPPDTIWSYSSGTTNIVSAIIRRSVGDTLQDYYTFSQERLFRPLNIRTAVLESDRSGNFVGSSYLYASARDWARLGQFCLQEGVWNGQRILPEEWMRYLITPTPTTAGNEYGAHFWLNRDPDNPARQRLFPDLPQDAYYMGGFQGQIVLVVPSEELVIARFGFTPARNHGIDRLAAKIIAQPKSEDEAS